MNPPHMSSATSPASATAHARPTVDHPDTAAGTAPTNQWEIGGVNLSDGSAANRSTISGSTTANLTLTGVYVADAGSYTCDAHNAAGDALSPAVTLAVNDPAIATQPANLTVAQGSTTAFSVVANGTPTLTYQWYFNSSVISGATASSYSKTWQLADAGSYYVVINGNGSASSDATGSYTITVSGTQSPKGI